MNTTNFDLITDFPSLVNYLRSNEFITWDIHLEDYNTIVFIDSTNTVYCTLQSINDTIAEVTVCTIYKEKDLYTRYINYSGEINFTEKLVKSCRRTISALINNSVKLQKLYLDRIALKKELSKIIAEISKDFVGKESLDRHSILEYCIVKPDQTLQVTFDKDSKNINRITITGDNIIQTLKDILKTQNYVN